MKKPVLVFIVSVLFISCWYSGRFKSNSGGWRYNDAKWGSFETHKYISLPKPLKKNWVLIEGGTFQFPNIEGTDSVNFFSEWSGRYSTPRFYAYNKEITNKEYREFVNTTKNFAMKPDTLVWIHDFKYSYNDPMTRMYFWLSKYDDYPVVGVSQIQAKAYCEWLQNKLNEEFRRSKKYRNRFCVVRLPSNLEWNVMFYMTYLYKGRSKYENINSEPHFQEAIHKYLINYGRDFFVEGIKSKEYGDDGEIYSAKYDRYKPANNGLYNLAGNVAEWTLSPAYNHTDSSKVFIISSPHSTKKRVVRFVNHNNVERYDTLKDYRFDYRYDFKPIYEKDGYVAAKGGSWYHSSFYLQPLVSLYCQSNEKHSYIGFRPILELYDTANGRKARIRINRNGYQGL